MSDRFIPYIVTLLVTISVLLAGWFYDHSEEERFRQSQRIQVAQQIDTIQAKLEKFLYDRLLLVRGLVAFVKARPHFTEPEFQQFARGLQDKQEVIRSLQLAPGSVVTHIYPLAGNEAALGHDLMADPDRRVEVQRAIDNRLFVIAGPVNLRQGGVALIGRTPIFLPRSDEPSGPDRYWGLAIILVDLEPLLRDAGILEKPAGLRFALRGKHGLGAQGERFFGPEAIFESDPVLAQVVLPNGSWQLAAVPAGGWPSPRPGAFVERAVTLWLAGVTGFLIWLLARGRAKLRKAVDEATRDLMLQTEALSASEARLRSITANMPGALFRRVHTPDGTRHYPFVSAAFKEVFGHDPERLMTDAGVLNEMVHPDDVEMLQSAMARSVERLEGQDVEYRIVTPAGQTKWVRSVAQPRRLENDDVVVDGIVLDITELKRAEEEIHRLSLRNEMLLNSAGEGIYGLDLEGRTTFINPAAARMIGWDPDDLIGQPQHDILHHSKPDGSPYPREECPIYAALKDGTVHQVSDEVFWRKDGTSFPIEYMSTPIVKDGKPVGAVVVFRDITERKRAEEALAESEAFYRAIIDHSPGAVVIKDTEGRYLTVNKQFCDWYGTTTENIVGKSVDEFLSKESADRVVAQEREVLETGTVINEERQITYPDGVTRDVFAQKFPIFGPDGGCLSIGTVISDITERKRTEYELQTFTEQLEDRVRERTAELRDAQDQLLRKERLAAIGQITATVSHELRNPLGTIRASIYSISKKMRDKDVGVEQALDRVERNITRCDDIIEDLLEFSRVRELAREATAFDGWLDGVLDEQRLPDGVALRRDLGAGVEVDIDPERMRRAVINLIDNACQAMTGGAADGGRERVIAVETRAANGHVELAVADTGPGIPADVLPKVFEPLFSTKSFGVGLGLPTVKQIVEQHGGGIEISSEEGRGSRVVLWLPLSKNEEEQAG